jgi:Superinfection immunity protein
VHLAAMFFRPFFGFGFVMYFLPVIVALVRSRRDTLSIFLLNFFLGWTFIGWVVALVWAFKPEAQSSVVSR